MHEPLIRNRHDINSVYMNFAECRRDLISQFIRRFGSGRHQNMVTVHLSYGKVVYFYCWLTCGSQDRTSSEPLPVQQFGSTSSQIYQLFSRITSRLLTASHLKKRSLLWKLCLQNYSENVFRISNSSISNKTDVPIISSDCESSTYMYRYKPSYLVSKFKRSHTPDMHGGIPLCYTNSWPCSTLSHLQGYYFRYKNIIIASGLRILKCVELALTFINTHVVFPASERKYTLERTTQGINESESKVNTRPRANLYILFS